ncbi:MAG TPA: sigma-70 family RNA polymerase sigma factor [Acidimicrobiia bacterium]|nr:sigma-70 family RNA polymerase sigma factor [Acidimicrobiia bacterium]
MERERVVPIRPDDLVERARAGDRDAFGELVRIHQHEVFTLAVRLVHDRDLAADVTQDAFVRAWRAMPKFRGDAKFSTWLHRITVNTAWTHRTRRNRVRLDPLESLAAEPESASLDPIRAGESAILAPTIADALASLSSSVRAVVVLKDIYDWSHAEIADHLDITVTAAKVRLHRGRKELRESLRGWKDGSE